MTDPAVPYPSIEGLAPIRKAQIEAARRGEIAFAETHPDFSLTQPLPETDEPKRKPGRPRES